MLSGFTSLRVKRSSGSPDVSGVRTISFANAGLNVSNDGGGAVTVTNSMFGTALLIANNLSDLADTSAATTNLLGNSGSVGDVLTFNGSTWGPATPSPGVSPGNPTASVGLSAVNGSASTYMRSDAAPALSQSIAPTWTGLHTFAAAAGTKKAIFKGGVSESVHVTDWQDSGGTPRVYVDSDFSFHSQMADNNYIRPFRIRYGNGNAAIDTQINGTLSTGYALLQGGKTDGNTYWQIGGDPQGNPLGISFFWNGNSAVNFAFGVNGANESLLSATGVIRMIPTGNFQLWQGNTTAGTAAPRLEARGRSSNSNLRDIYYLDGVFASNTDASWKGRLVAYAADSGGSQEGWRIESSGSAALIGFLGASASARQTSGADLTNNVTSGGTNDVIADFTSLTVYATDAATIRNDIYQLARKLAQVNNALRLYGLLT